MEIKATASGLHLRERRQMQNEIKIAESRWKCLFTMPAGEQGTETLATTKALPKTRRAAGSPSCMQQASRLKQVLQVRGFNSPAPAVSYQWPVSGWVNTFLHLNQFFHTWYLHPFLDTCPPASVLPSMRSSEPQVHTLPSGSFALTEPAPYTAVWQNTN